MSARLFHIAWRNLWRNPRRTSITVAAIAVGYIMLLLFACLLEGLGQHMIDTGTRFLLSHVQVHAPDYYPDRSIHVTLGGQRGTEVRSLIDVLTADPRVRAAAPRVYGYGLVSSAYHSAGAELVGVVPTQEVQVTNLHTCLVHGRYLTAQVPKGILLGETLAASIRATVGAELVLLTQAADGSLGNDLYTVVGVFRTGSAALDRGLVLMSLAAVQELLSLAPRRIHEVALRLTDAAAATTIAASLESRLRQKLPVRVRAWSELSPELAEYVRLNRSSATIIFFIVFVVAAIGIMNTMLMAVFERTRELGVLMALGLRPLHVVVLVLAEAGVLAGVSLMLGSVLGAPLLWYLEVYGLDLRNVVGEFSMAGAVFDPLWYGRQNYRAYWQAAEGLALTAIVAALYPAVRAARFQPATAIRHH